MNIPAFFKELPEDFHVEELPVYEPSGEGPHVFLTIRKKSQSTSWVARAIAKHLHISSRDIGHAGMKDRHAVTVQRLSVPYPEDQPLQPLLDISAEGFEVLDAKRHGNKLRVGHLLGNRFRVTLRGIEEAPGREAMTKLRELTDAGFPNAYGPQRFGRDGDNPERALAWLRGDAPAPRDRREKKLLFSSVQSMLFDKVLDQRMRDGTWNTVIEGDLAKTRQRGGLFLVESPEIDAERANSGEISATGPMYGPKMRWPSGAPELLERDVLATFLGTRQPPAWFGKLGSGTRRPLRVWPEDFAAEMTDDERHPGFKAIVLSFTLPKGAYATTFLLQAFHLGRAPEGVQPLSPTH